MRRILSFLIPPAFLVVVGVIAYAAWTAGGIVGEPDAIEAVTLEETPAVVPPVDTPFYGFEGVDATMRLAGWGTVSEVRPAPEGSPAGALEVVLDTGSGELIVTLTSDDFVRMLGEAVVQTGDTLSTRDGQVLLTR